MGKKPLIGLAGLAAAVTLAAAGCGECCRNHARKEKYTPTSAFQTKATRTDPVTTPATGPLDPRPADKEFSPPPPVKPAETPAATALPPVNGGGITPAPVPSVSSRQSGFDLPARPAEAKMNVPPTPTIPRQTELQTVARPTGDLSSAQNTQTLPPIATPDLPPAPPFGGTPLPPPPHH